MREYRVFLLNWTVVLLAGAAMWCVVEQRVNAQDSLPPLVNGTAPKTLDELWKGYDPRAEPLDTEVIKEWEEDGVVCRVVRYRVGVFKGVKSMVAAVYAFPKGGSKLPGLVQIHGGGQSANLNAVTTNARRGYACISINWGGYPMGIPNYQGINTDWGAIDATMISHNTHYATLAPDEKTIDPVESPRNSNWFLDILAARRALTFLEQRPEVDGTKLGVYGHSMGGKLTFDTAAIDPRVKAAAPSCGGACTDLVDTLYGRTVDSAAYASKLSCPVIFLNPANDFAGPIDGIEKSVELMPSKVYRYTRVAHLNHRDMPDHLVCNPLWFDEQLKGTFSFPKTPSISLDLHAKKHVPVVTVTPDASRKILEVEVYYTQDGGVAWPLFRFWHYAKPVRRGKAWVVDMPLASVEKPLWVYANVRYGLKQPITGAGYYYGLYTANDFSISSIMLSSTAEQLRAAKIEATLRPSLLIEPFGPDWKKEWYTFIETGTWPYRTVKLNSALYKAPDGAMLALDIRCAKPNRLVLNINEYGSEAAAEVAVKGGNEWQTVVLHPADFTHAQKGSPLSAWPSPCEFVFGETGQGFKDGKTVTLGGDWQGALPELRNLRWVPGDKTNVSGQ